MINIREKLIDLIARIIEQWIAQGDFRVGGYVIRRGDVVERLHLRDIENLVVANDVMESEMDENN